MDDLLREFLTETSESLDTVDNQLVRFEQEPNNAKILDNIFRLVHTIKGTCGFLGLPRLEALAHAGETLMGKFRDGMPVTAEGGDADSDSIDRIKEILGRAGGHRGRAGRHRSGPDRRIAGDGGAWHGSDVSAGYAGRGSAGYRRRRRRRRPHQNRRLPSPLLPRSHRALWCRRRWSGRCVPAKCRWMNWSARSARPRPRLRRHRRRLSPRRKPEAAPVKPAAAAKETEARGSQIGHRGRRARSRQSRQPVDPGQRGYAGTSDDDGVGTGSDPQSAAGDLPAQRGHRVQGAAAAAVQRHRRAAGRRHEDADAADRQCLAEAAAHRARPLAANSASRSNWRCTAPTPSSTARCST